MHICLYPFLPTFFVVVNVKTDKFLVEIVLSDPHFVLKFINLNFSLVLIVLISYRSVSQNR